MSWCELTIDLKAVADETGRRKRDEDGVFYVDYKIAQARKLLRLIHQNGTEEDFKKCDKYFAENALLMSAWRRIHG